MKHMKVMEKQNHKPLATNGTNYAKGKTKGKYQKYP